MRIAAALLALGVAAPAAGYELSITARTTGQAYTVRWFRSSEADRLLNRRRMTQELGLELWDLLEPERDEPGAGGPARAPFELYLSTDLRVDHDFGEYVQGTIKHAADGGGTVREAATTVVPEIGADDYGLAVLHGFVGARGIGGVVDAELGRLVLVDNLDWYSLDGLHVRARLPFHLAVEGQVGVLVREGSPVGLADHEPDGTSDAQCRAFVEGAYVPSRDCPQRDQTAPTFGVALATRGLADFGARISYRRTVSRAAAGVFPDAGGWGTIEEKASAELRASLFSGALVPWAAARWNLLLGVVDEAHAGVRASAGAHALTLEALYSYPSFDGDSIFNVFSVEPYWDARATWDLWPGRGPLRGYLRGFYRRFDDASAGGGGAGARWSAGGDRLLRLDLFYEDGYGGLRAGGDLSGRWPLVRKLAVEGRLSIIRFDAETLRGTTLGAQAGAEWRFGPGIVLHLIGEENSNRYDRSQLRILAILDLAFRPEH